MTYVIKYEKNKGQQKLNNITANFFSKFLKRLNKAVTEDMSDFDPQAEYDTRVKLPGWQTARLRDHLKDKTPITNKLDK
jgi:hypothetical protein|tara:strand:- start:290 stop:526 length:237 start_codon:yes stop_codon:yes gene_type:complete